MVYFSFHIHTLFLHPGSEKDLKALGEHVRGVFRMREGEGGQGGLPRGSTLHSPALLALGCAPLCSSAVSRPRVRLSGVETLPPAQSGPLTWPLTVELAALGLEGGDFSHENLGPLTGWFQDLGRHCGGP